MYGFVSHWRDHNVILFKRSWCYLTSFSKRWMIYVAAADSMNRFFDLESLQYYSISLKMSQQRPSFLSFLAYSINAKNLSCIDKEVDAYIMVNERQISALIGSPLLLAIGLWIFFCRILLSVQLALSARVWKPLRSQHCLALSLRDHNPILLQDRAAMPWICPCKRCMGCMSAVELFSEVCYNEQHEFGFCSCITECFIFCTMNVVSHG